MSNGTQTSWWFKLAAFLPLVATIFALVYSQFDPAVWAYIQAHPNIAVVLGALFVASETLGGLSFIKSNSVAQAFFSFFVVVLSKILRKSSA